MNVVGKLSLHMVDERVTVGLIWIGWKLRHALSRVCMMMLFVGKIVFGIHECCQKGRGRRVMAWAFLGVEMLQRSNARGR